VLEALARALELDDAERAHLFDLARAAQPTGAPPRQRRTKQRVRPEVQWTLDAITGAAAFVGNQRLDLLAANQLGRALFSELYAAPARPVNTARFVFLDPRAEATFGDWERVAGECVAILRWAAGRDPVGFVNSVVTDFQGNPDSVTSGTSAATSHRGGYRRATERVRERLPVIFQSRWGRPMTGRARPPRRY